MSDTRWEVCCALSRLDGGWAVYSPVQAFFEFLKFLLPSVAMKICERSGWGFIHPVIDRRYARSKSTFYVI